VFILKLLGGASVDGPDGPLTGKVAQRRPLAALALLAMHPRQGLGREKLAALLWPDIDGERARHRLSDTIYVVNRELGGEAITPVGDALRLAPERLRCDARLFEEAVAGGGLEEAVRLYTGPFMDGFHLDANEEFERWLTAERDRLHDVHARALERLATERSDRGDRRGAVECWRALAVDDPFNSRVAGALASALALAGDRAGALQHLKAHEASLARELGIAPPADLAALARTLRAAPAVADTVSPPVTGAPAAAEAAEAAPDAIVNLPEPSAPVADRAAMAVAADPAPPPAYRRPLVAAGAAVVVLLVVSAVLAFRASDAAPSRPAATAVQALAVLPFADLSPGRDHEYLGDGVAEELSTRLGRVTGLKVAARTSAFAFKGTDTDVTAIGRALNVDALVEGSVRESDGQVRVAVRLVNARDGYQMWTGTWTRSGQDVLALQDEIATGVLRALRPDGLAGPPVPAARVIDRQAYDHYLQGRFLWHQRTGESLLRAAQAFDRAVALAPDYAAAHSGVADAYAVLGFYDHLPPHDAFPRAKAAARRALELDDQLAQAHASLGYVALYYDWDWPTAERELARAIALNPNYSVGHQWLANYYVARGRFDEAVAAMRTAQETDPLSLIASAALGWIHYYRRDFDAAVAQCRLTIGLSGTLEQAWLWGGQAHEAAGRPAEALTMLNRAAELSKRSPIVLAALGRAHALAGDVSAAKRIADELQRGRPGYVPAYELAKLQLALGHRAEALALLRRAHAERSHSLVFLAVDPQLDRLRSDPAFRALAAETGVTAAP
jgi:TolB-like protein/DNA-binding SARP family transcriptional activator/tetratricopeptide (TPR) repeat protein